MSPSHALRVLFALALLLFALPAARAEDAAEEADALPLVRVALFTSGVGYFEHRATLEGTKQVTLTFDADDVNDLLKSMVVQDLGGGRVSTVTYGSRDPVAKALQSFAIDLTQNLTLADLFTQLRGEAVAVEAPTPVEGTILSVQSRAVPVEDKVVTQDYLNLLTKEGVRSIPFDSVRTIRLLDARLDQEMRQALATLSLGRDNQKKSVTLEFLGEGSRPVQVGYVQETPVWKTSYRLVLAEDGAYLQGWAIVENTTNRDWNGVDLTLVSGAPVSFVMNLYEPLYAERPVVEPELRTGVAPQRYDRSMEPQADAESLELEDKQEVARKARSMDRLAGGGRPGAPPAPAMAPAEGSVADFGRGVESMAAGAEVGELFQYHIANPVTLARQRSAMLPIVGDPVKAEKVSIYDPSVHPKHPLNGVELENDTPLHLMQGPVTVFDGGVYAGDALLGDLPPAAKRLITYAMDLEAELSIEMKSRPEELLAVQLTKGTLLTTYRLRRERHYHARNDDAKPKKILIAQGLDADWSLVEPREPAETTRAQYRFLLAMDPRSKKDLAVVEERTERQQVLLSSLRDDTVAVLLRAPSLTARVREALQEVVRRNAALGQIAQGRRLLEAQMKGIEESQARVRQNMAAIDRASDLYARYLKDLTVQEDQIQALRGQIDESQRREADAKKALDEYLMGLQVE